MLPTMPTLPAKTAFKLDQDEFGQTRLRWGGRMRRFLDLAVVPTSVAVTITLLAIFGWILGGPSLTGWFCGCWSSILVMIGMVVLLAIATDTSPEASLVLTEAWLLYDEGREAPPGPLAQWDRWRLKDARLEPRVVGKWDWRRLARRGRGRQRLLLDDGGLHQVEIGPSLSDPDRQWLAEVIRDWIPPPGITQLSPESEAMNPMEPEG